jgi:ABC-type Na+ efflux pump permease subunit
MKSLNKNLVHHFTVVSLLFWLVAFWGIFIPSSAISETSVADEIISLDVTDQPLGEVLKKISAAAGCKFRIDESWEDYPVTASFKDKPLYRGLKIILRDFSNAVIFGSDRTIKIIIHEEGTTSEKTTGSSDAASPSRAAERQARPEIEESAPQPEAELPEDSSSEENAEQPAEEAAENASEAEQESAEKTEETEEAASEGGQEQSEDSASEQTSEQTEETPGEGENQAEETESDSEKPEEQEGSDSQEKTGTD